jgi:hypothetical protein
MTRSILRRICGPVVLLGLLAPLTIHCSQLKQAASAAGVPGGNCPDMTKIEEIDKFDFAANFKLQADAAGKIKAGVGAAVALQELADKIDGDLKGACLGIAHDLGDAGDYKNGPDACNAAVKVIGAVKAKLGASAKIGFDFSEPHCGIEVNAYADCAGGCDASVKGPTAEVQCEPGKLSGSCGAQCSGDCEASAAAACSGECNGSCDADISGSCDGNCSGKCDGKSSSGASCAGKCDGKCSGNVKGTCKGKCGGSCHMSAAASCSGTCTGSCSAKMEAPKCTGTATPPKVNAQCRAKCDAQLQAKYSCVPPHVNLRITGAADAKLAATFQTTIEKNFPVILSTAIALAKEVPPLVGNVVTVAEGVQGSLKAAASDPKMGVALGACVGKPFAGVAGAADSIKGNLSVSVNVQASVSASGSAGGKAGGG